MPVHLAHVEDRVGQIAELVRLARTRKGLSLRQLASATGISAAQISSIETGKTGTDIAQLLKFAETLGVALGDLLPPPSIRHYWIDRSREPNRRAPAVVPRVRDGHAGAMPYHNAFWPLAEPYSEKRLEAYVVRVEPLDDRDLALVTTEPETLAFVLRGAMEFRAKIAGEVSVQRLGAGDAIFWDSHVPHVARAMSRDPTQVLCVCSNQGAPRFSTELAIALAGGAFPMFRERESENAVTEIGHRIAFVRQTYGVSVADLAHAVGLSPRQLRAVESGARPARIDTLYRLARVFQRPASYFLPKPHDGHPAYALQRADTIVASPSLHRADGSQAGVRYHPLLAQPVERALHPYLVRLPADGPETESCFSGQQLFYVLNGEVEFVFKDQKHTACELLHPGDSVYFQTSYPHRIRGIGKSPFASHAAEGVAVIWSPTDNPGLVPVEP